MIQLPWVFPCPLVFASYFDGMRRLAALSILLATVLPLSAEDWTTVDGKTYQDVNVVKAEDDGVNITYTGGDAKIPYYNLPLEIQKKFGQDPDTLAAAKKAADAAEANKEAADAQAKKEAEDLKRQQADDILQIKALAVARNANQIELSAEALRVADPTAYPGADYSYNKYSDTSYLDSPPATVVPLPAPTVTDALSAHAALTLRTVTIGPKPEQPDKYLATFVSVSPLRKFTDNHQVIFLVDGLTMAISQDEMKDTDFFASPGQVVEFVTFYLSRKQVDAIVDAKSVKFCVGANNFSLNKDEVAKLRSYVTVLDKNVDPASSIVFRKLHQWFMAIPPASILISDICIYFLTGSFAIVVCVGVTACFVGASRFFNM